MTSISHEAEVQRQHTRYRIPMKVEIQGRTYDVADWSIGGFSLSSRDAKFVVGKLVPVKVSFPFTDYALDLAIDAEARYASDERTGFKFVNVTRRQADVLRFIIDAYLSGEVVDARDIIEISARHNEAKSRPIPAAPGATALGLVSRVGRLAAAGIAGLLLVGFVGTSLYERLFIVPARAAIVTTDLVVIPAPIGGSVAFVAQGESVKRGEAVAALETIDGKTSIISSPCDCSVQIRHTKAGEFLTLGQPMVSLKHQDAKPYVTALVPREDIMRIYDRAIANVTLTDGRRVADAKPRVMPANEQSANDPGSNELIKVIVDLGDSMGADKMIGQPAKVEFRTDLSSLGLPTFFSAFAAE